MQKKRKANCKVRNATPTEVDGVKFRSKLEAFTYKQLLLNNISAQYESEKFLLVPAFEYHDEKVRPMTYTPDFVGKTFIIECKGNPNDAFPLKWKLFKYSLFKNGLNFKLFLVHNQKEVLTMIETLKNEHLCQNFSK